MTDQGPYRFYDPADRKGRRTRWIWIIGAVLLAAFVIWLVAPHDDQSASGPGAQGGQGGRGAMGGGGGRGGGGGGRGGRGGAPSTVGSAKLAKSDAPIYLYALGTATPTQTVTVRTQISGQLQTVAFREGQMVKKGQFLAQIDPRPYEQQLAQAEGTLAKDQATLANARLDLKRYQTLLAQDSIARQQVDTQAALVRQYEAQVKSDQAAVGAQRLNLTYAHIVSPISGRVGLRQVDPGNYVTPGDTNGIVVVTEVNPIDVLFTVPEDNLPQVSAALRGGPLEATAFDRTQQTQLAVGRLLTLDNQVDTTTGTVRAKARFDNSSGALFPNQFVNIRLLVSTLKGVVMAPTSAVLRGSQGLFVWVVDPDDKTVSMRTVKTGPAVGDNTAITSGLDAGEIVVTDGSDRLREGQRVFLAGDCIPARRPGGASGPGSKDGQGGGKWGGRGGQGGGVSAEPPKTIFNLFGLLGGKPKAQPDPYAAMRCQPGQRPGGMGGSIAAPGAGAGAGGRSGGGLAGAPGAASRTGAPNAGPGQGPGPGQGQPAANGGGPEGGQNGGGAPGGGASGGGGRGGRMAAMYAQLGLDPGQKAKIDAIMASDRPKLMALFQSGDMDAARAARQAMQQKIDAVLRPDQKAKLAELRAQSGGGGPGGQ